MIKPLNKDIHGKSIKDIWDLRQLPHIADDLFPSTGLVYEKEGVPVAFGFIYTTNSKFALLEWVCTNPQSDKGDRHEALSNLIPSLLKLAKNLGAKVVFTSVEDKGLLNRYLENGARIGDTSMTNLIWSLEN